MKGFIGEFGERWRADTKRMSLWDWLCFYFVLAIIVGYMVFMFWVRPAGAENKEFFPFRDSEEVYCIIWEEKKSNEEDYWREKKYKHYWVQTFKCNASIQELIEWMNKREQEFVWGKLAGPSKSKKYLGIFKLEKMELKRKLKKLRLPYIEWGVKNNE